MKNIIFTLLALIPALWMPAQQTSIPGVDLKDINGKTISSLEITEPGTSTLVVFWSSSSGKCFDNLDMLQEAWEGTLKQKGVKLVAVCVDCNGNWTQVKPIVNGNNWDFDTYIDVNGDFKRAMHVGEVPCTMLYNGEQNLVCSYNSVSTGNQEFLCENIIEHLAGPVTASYIDAAK